MVWSTLTKIFASATKQNEGAARSKADRSEDGQQERTPVWLQMPQGLRFAALQLAHDFSGQLTWDRSVIERITDANPLLSRALLRAREDLMLAGFASWHAHAVAAGEPAVPLGSQLQQAFDGEISLGDASAFARVARLIDSEGFGCDATGAKLSQAMPDGAADRGSNDVGGRNRRDFGIARACD